MRNSVSLVLDIEFRSREMQLRPRRGVGSFYMLGGGGGGQALRVTFRIKKASKNFFPEMLATGKMFRTYQKNFQDISNFFLKMKNLFRIYQKNFRIYDYIPGN